MTRKNTRTLDEIADRIHKLERTSIFEIGDLLIEAKEQQCEHGEWLNWLDDEFEWSPDTAENYMNVARLGAKFRNFRNLKLGKTTLYQLADHKPEDELPAIIKELAQHATKKRLPPRDAERVIDIGVGRHRYGDHPGATLAALVDLDEYKHRDSWHEKAVAELLRLEPDNEEAADAIIDNVSHQDDDGEGEDDAAKVTGGADKQDEAADDASEAEKILDGPSPDVPPPTPSNEPQKLGAETMWSEAKEFDSAVTNLFALRGKPVARFVGRFDSDQLREVVDFLMAVVSRSKPTAA